MADKSTTTFPKMGESIVHGVVHAPAQQSPNVKPVRKTGNAKGGTLEPATANHRSGGVERLGFRGAPVLSHVVQTAPEAGLTKANVVPIPSAIKRGGDFWSKRQYGQTGAFG